jgi:hypothetical protein
MGRVRSVEIVVVSIEIVVVRTEGWVRSVVVVAEVVDGRVCGRWYALSLLLWEWNLRLVGLTG